MKYFIILILLTTLQAIFIKKDPEQVEKSDGDLPTIIYAGMGTSCNSTEYVLLQDKLR